MSLTVQNNTPQVQMQTPQNVPGAETTVQTGDVGKIMEEAVGVMQGVSLQVTELMTGGTDGTKKVDGTKKTVDPEEVPEISDDEVSALLDILGDLEKLLAELKADSTEEQIALTKERIANLKDKLAKQHTERQGKIDESMKKLNEATAAEKAQERMGIISCVMACVAALVAVAAAIATPFTAGGSLAVAVCVISAIGALCAVGGAAVSIYQQVNKDDLEQQVKDKAAEYRKQGMSDSQAMTEAYSDVNDKFLYMSIAFGIGSLVCGLASGGAGSAGTLAKVLSITQGVMSGAGLGLGAAGQIISADASEKSYDAQSTQAELSKLEAVLAKLKKSLEENSDEIQALMEQLMQALADLAKLLESAITTADEVTQQTGATA